jgi:hypothetical protein
MRPQDRTADEVIARLAGAAHGVVTRGELLQAGATVGEIRHRLRSGALRGEHAGVYRAGHQAPSTEATYLAAVRACGRGALLTGAAAAHIYSLIPGPAPLPEVTAATERRIRGIRAHRRRHIDPRDVTVWRGIPVTTVPATLVDLAGLLTLDALGRACHEAEVLHHARPAAIQKALARRHRTAGAANLRSILSGDVRVTLSGLESRFLERLDEAGLALPETNRLAGTRRVDCRWPEHRLTVELDSYRFHHSRHAWEQDRRREREARARGDDFRRYTYADVVEEPGAMLAELRALIPPARPG